MEIFFPVFAKKNCGNCVWSLSLPSELSSYDISEARKTWFSTVYAATMAEKTACKIHRMHDSDRHEKAEYLSEHNNRTLISAKQVCTEKWTRLCTGESKVDADCIYLYAWESSDLCNYEGSTYFVSTLFWVTLSQLLSYHFEYNGFMFLEILIFSNFPSVLYISTFILHYSKLSNHCILVVDSDYQEYFC